MNEKLEIKYEWKCIFKKTNLKELNKKNILKQIDSKPAIYQFTIYDYNGAKEIYYIGETVNLKNRLKGYFNPGPTQFTNKRMNEVLGKYKFDFHTLSIAHLKICNKIIISSKEDQDKKLKVSFTRKLIENYFIVKTKYIDEKKVLNKEERAK